MVELLYFSMDGCFEFIIPLKYFKNISKEAIACSPNETGGIFVGCYDKDFHSARVSRLLFNKRDKGFFAKFVREGEKLTKLLNKIWRASKGKEYYIGEWHSHPKCSPLPSDIDSSNMIDMAKKKEEECRRPILAILGEEMKDYRRDLVVFVYPNEKEMVRLDFRGEIA